MRVLIAYASKYGSTEKCAKRLASMLPGKVTLANLKNERPSVEGFDVVVIGSPIYVGKPMKEIVSYWNSVKRVVKGVKVGVFMLHLMKDCISEMDVAFPKDLLDAASAKGTFGGRIEFDRLSLPDKLVTGMLSRLDSSLPTIGQGTVYDTIDDAALKEFVKQLEG